MTLDGKILRGLFKHERLKPHIITSQGNVYNLPQLKQVVNIGMILKNSNNLWNSTLVLVED